MKICSKCGAPVADFDKFCQECGAPAPVKSDPTQDERLYGISQGARQASPAVSGKGNKNAAEPGPLKKQLSLKPSKSFVKGLVLGLAIMVAAFIAMLNMNAVTFGMAKTALTQTEGAGYRSADEAVKAYANAFAQKDYDKMISSFAVETYVSHYDLAAQIDRMKAYIPVAVINLPDDNAFVTSILRENRIGELNRMISNQYMQITGIYDKIGGPENYGKPIPLDGSTYKSGTDMVDALLSGGRRFDGLTIEVGSVIMPDTLSEQYGSENNQENLRKQMSVYHADQVENRAVELTVNGEKYLLCMQCVCYGGKWYNDTQMGNLAMLLGMPVSSGGMAKMSELDI